MELKTKRKRRAWKIKIIKIAAAVDPRLMMKEIGRVTFSLRFSAIFLTRGRRLRIRKKRKSEVKKISAGDLVKPAMEIKAAFAGEKKGRDLTFSRLLMGKNKNLRPIKIKIMAREDIKREDL